MDRYHILRSGTVGYIGNAPQVIARPHGNVSGRRRIAGKVSRAHGNLGSRGTHADGDVSVGRRRVIAQRHGIRICSRCLIAQGNGVGPGSLGFSTDGNRIVFRIVFFTDGDGVHDVGRRVLIIGFVANGYVIAVLVLAVVGIADVVPGTGPDGHVVVALRIAAGAGTDGDVLHARHIVACFRTDGDQGARGLGFAFAFRGPYACVIAQGNGTVRIGRCSIADGQRIKVIGGRTLADGRRTAGCCTGTADGIAAFTGGLGALADDHGIGPGGTGAAADGHHIGRVDRCTGAHDNGIGGTGGLGFLAQDQRIIGRRSRCRTADGRHRCSGKRRPICRWPWNNRKQRF